jgi:hypothetical protein
VNPDYVLILNRVYPGAQWTLNGDTYDGLTWLDDTPKPTQETLDALWPTVAAEVAAAAASNRRHYAYITESDGLFFQWQRGEATKEEWLAAVAKVQAENPAP